MRSQQNVQKLVGCRSDWPCIRVVAADTGFRGCCDGVGNREVMEGERPPYMKSSRFPGSVLRFCGGRPLLADGDFALTRIAAFL
jgi:hypothetical protein